MTVARDQAATGQALANVSSVTLTWPVLPAAGSKCIVIVGGSVTQAVTGAVDNGVTPSTFTADLSIAPGVRSGKYILRADGISLPASGSYKVTITLAGSTSGITCSGRTYTGVAAGAPVSTINTQGNGNSPVTGNVTPAVAGSLLVGSFVDASFNVETITLTTPGANSFFQETDGVHFLCGGFADNIVASNAAQGLAWTISDSPDWGGIAAVYSPAGTALRLSAASKAGNDPRLGTPYQAGWWAYGNSGSAIGLQVNGAQPKLAMSPGASIYTNAGAPTISGVAGDLYIRSDGGAGTYLYRCTGGAAWTAFA